MGEARAQLGSSASSYEILGKLAEGGMAEILLARGASEAGVARLVVLKRILRERADNPDAIRMFLDEARVAAQLQHANIAQVYDIGKLGDSYFFTMEYVHGETVAALIRRSVETDHPLPLASILTIVAGAAAGLHHAHERVGVDGNPLGIVHRDVSSANLMIGYDGAVKLVDFGIAKSAERSVQTQLGRVKGNSGYMSPEQCRAQPLDRRSDLFSLGVVLWELITCERLYRRGTEIESMMAIIHEPPPPPSRRREGVPPEIDAIAGKLLAKQPDDRYASADALLAAVEDAAVASRFLLSTASLGRVMKGLFGSRSEPRGTGGHAITVCSEPIPEDLSHTATNATDVLLERIRAEGTRDAPAEPEPEPDLDPDLLPRRARRGWILLLVLLGLAAGVALAVIATSRG